MDRRALATLIAEELAEFSMRSAADRSTHSLETARVVTVDGRDLDLVFKGTRASRGSGDFVRPRLVRDESREVWAYSSLLDPRAIDTPRFYGVLDEGGAGERLVLEALPGRPLTESGDIDAWRAAARWLAAFHEWGDRRVSGLGEEDPVLHQTPALHERWLERAIRRAAAEGRAAVGTRLNEIRAAHRVAVCRLAGGRRGLVHGEFYPSNLLVARRGSGWRIRAVDWESIGVGPVALDLAALTTGDWAASERTALWREYADARDTPLETLTPDLHAARLVNAVQWLGWTVGWTPPVEHDRDWIEEARDAARHVLDETGSRPVGPHRGQKLPAP
ncbi:MAG: phosphotransferase [Gemmatimonadota bacterium]|nr:phosphotransferase [Gemmatimonadota bacterium]